MPPCNRAPRVSSLRASASVRALGGPITAQVPITAPEPPIHPPTPPVGIPISKLLSNSFPLPLSQAYQQWTRRSLLQQAQDNVLSFLPFFPVPHQSRSAKSLRVPIGNNLHINEFHIQSSSSHTHQHLLLLHGYGAGLAFFYRNLDQISSRPGWNIHAIDLLGYGLSSRPPFSVSATDPFLKIAQSEAFFLDAIEAWRRKRNISSFLVVAHSLGAYLMSAYAAKYPGRVSRLVLVSPAGVPRSSASILSYPPTTSLAPSPKVPQWFNYLWEKHVSPFSLVRLSGPLGPKFVSAWTSRRFAALPKPQADALHEYAYAIFNAKGSGEYALNYLLAPGATARWPLADRAIDIPCPTKWIYGSNDWMDVNAARDVVAEINKKNVHPASLDVVDGAGHHIYLDNPARFNQLVLDEMALVDS